MNQAEFKNPVMDTRPKIRWWVPGADMTVAEITHEIDDMVQAGFGGAEVCPVAPNGQDGSQIEWGNAHWNTLMRQALNYSATLNFTLDFSMTPSWPLALPTIKDINDPEQGAQMELDGGHVDGITALNPYSGPVPDYSSKKHAEEADNRLLAVTVAKYRDKGKHILQADSARMLPSSAYQLKNGTYVVNYHPNSDGEYVLFGWWEHPSANKTYDYYQLDHFGTAGTKTLVDYWETNLLPALGESATHIDNMFIDSLEFETHLDWTRGLDVLFEEIEGYSIYQWLPEMYDSKAVGNFWGEPQPEFSFDGNAGHARRDYLDVLTTAYIKNHIQPITRFCKRHGFKLRYQSAYGKNIEQARSARYVQIPETECLYAGDMLDFYRCQSGSAHIEDKPLYSLEAAPEFDDRGNGEPDAGNYAQTWRDLMWHIQRAMIVGVNQTVVHGYSYRGQTDDGFIQSAQWPGFEGFRSNWWSNSWGERLPNWQDARYYTDYLARRQAVQRGGHAKVDVAIYSRSYYEIIDFLNKSKTQLYDDRQSLTNHGYSYEFISSSSLIDAGSLIHRQRLFETGPAYKALVFDNEAVINHEAYEALLKIVSLKFPVVFVGCLPKVETADRLTDMRPTLVDSETVLLVQSTDDVVDALKQLSVTPDLQFTGNHDGIVNFHYQKDQENRYFFYNQGVSETYPAAKKVRPKKITVHFPANSSVERLDCWTGTRQQLLPNKNGDYTFAVSGNDTAVLTVSKTNKQMLLTKIISDDQDVQNTQLLGPWALTIESWTPGSTPGETQKKVVFSDQILHLRSWGVLQQSLQYVSGIGEYATTFDLSGIESKIWLYLPEIVDTCTITVNGVRFIKNPEISELIITDAVHEGQNSIEIRVASTLLNAILKVHPEDQRTPHQYGILGDIQLITKKRR